MPIERYSPMGYLSTRYLFNQFQRNQRTYTAKGLDIPHREADTDKYVCIAVVKILSSVTFAHLILHLFLTIILLL
ncbi:MAG: hypothetical protein J6C92_13180 [Bacteroidaceae bacterium]|nr:hypothetical protein [Bacteroidaceae bacterium]